MRGISYSDEDKAKALALLAQMGGNAALVSYVSGISPRAIKRWADGEHVSPEVFAVAENKKAALADAWHDLMVRGLGVASGRVEDCTAAQACTIAAIAADKMLLLRGDPTAIEDHRHTVTVDQAERLARLSPEERDQLEALLAKMDGRGRSEFPDVSGIPVIEDGAGEVRRDEDGEPIFSAESQGLQQ